MKIERAIEILEKHGVTDKDTTWGEYLNAVQLSIEALKRIIDEHEDDDLLPGEG